MRKSKSCFHCKLTNDKVRMSLITQDILIHTDCNKYYLCCVSMALTYSVGLSVARNNDCSICDVTHWFVDFYFEASSFDFGRRHLGFMEPEVTIFGKEGDAEGESHDAK